METNDKNKIAKNPYIENNNTYIVWKRKTNTPIPLPTIYNSDVITANQSGRNTEYKPNTNVEYVRRRLKLSPNSKRALASDNPPKKIYTSL